MAGGRPGDGVFRWPQRRDSASAFGIRRSEKEVVYHRRLGVWRLQHQELTAPDASPPGQSPPAAVVPAGVDSAFGPGRLSSQDERGTRLAAGRGTGCPPLSVVCLSVYVLL